MIGAFLSSTARALLSPSVLATTAAATLLSKLCAWALNWPEAFDPLRFPWQFIALVALTGLWFWIALSIAATALAALRYEPETMSVTWITSRQAISALIATAATAAGVALGLLALIVPGVLLLIMWSQATMLVVDGRANGLDALEASRAFTSGFRLEILMCGIAGGGILLILQVGGSGLASLAQGIGVPGVLMAVARWIADVVLTTFSISAAAALYHTIDSRIEWVDAD